MKFSAFVGVAALALTTTLAGQTPSTPRITPPDGFPAVGEKPIVTLLAPGTNPRPPLRPVPQAGATEHMDMTMTMAIAMEIAGIQPPIPAIPPITLTSDLTASDPAANGDVTVSMAFTGATAAGPMPDPALTAMVQKMNNDIKATRGSIIVARDGHIVSQDFTLPTKENPFSNDPTKSLVDSLKDLTPQWPDGMIGVGGRWEARQSFSNSGVATFQKTAYEVTAIDANATTIRVTGEAHSPQQKIVTPELPPGAELMVDESTATTTGTMTVRTDSFVPDADITIKTLTRVLMSMNGESQPMSMTVNLGIKIRRR